MQVALVEALVTPVAAMLVLMWLVVVVHMITVVAMLLAS